MASQDVSAQTTEGKAKHAPGAKSLLERTKPLDDLMHEIMDCAGVSRLMEAHIVGCSHPDTEDLLLCGLSTLTQRLNDITNKYDTGELRDALTKAEDVPRNLENTMESHHTPSRPATDDSQVNAPRETVFSTLAECHDTTALLADYALNTANAAEEIGLMYAALNMLKNRLNGLMISVEGQSHD